MGTALTGLEIKDTYDSLIKVTDNGPLSATGKYLSDGLGNDSVLALSTTAVGVGTSSPAAKLQVSGGTTRLSSGPSGGLYGDDNASYFVYQASPTANAAAIYLNGTARTSYESQAQFAATSHVFLNETLGTELMRIRNTGNVGIGTSTPTATLDVSGTLAVSGNATFDTSTLVVDAANNQVGIGNTSPQGNLDVKGSTNVAVFLRNASNGDTNTDGLLLGNVGGIPASYQIWNYENGFLRFGTNSAERVRIDATGNVGIGTSTPTGKLTISQANSGGVAAILLSEDESTIQGPSANTYVKMGSNMALGAAGVIPILIANTEVLRVTANGLTFNGDTAAANALDDYEEGTFTPTFVGATITGGSIRGSYTKIGRQVYITVQFVNATISGAASTAQVQSLPFTNNALNFGVATITYCDSLNTTNASAWIDTSSTTIVLMDGTGTGSFASFVDGTSNRSIMLNAVYQV